MGPAPDEWSYGDLDAGFNQADLILDETFVTPDTSHQTLETRTAMAYWQNARSISIPARRAPFKPWRRLRGGCALDPTQVVLITEYTGGGFGSKVTGGISMIIPALLAKKAGGPLMMRISRGGALHRTRTGWGPGSRTRVGFTREGRITALDMFVIANNGPYESQYDAVMSGRLACESHHRQAVCPHAFCAFAAIGHIRLPRDHPSANRNI